MSLADLAIEFEDVAAGGAGIATEGRRSREPETIPAVTTLYQNRPNPFNPRTELRYRLEAQASVHLAIFDIAGRQIRVLVSERQQAGEHAVTWDGRDDTGSTVGSGLYLYQLTTDASHLTRKLVVLR